MERKCDAGTSATDKITDLSPKVTYIRAPFHQADADTADGKAFLKTFNRERTLISRLYPPKSTSR